MGGMAMMLSIRRLLVFFLALATPEYFQPQTIIFLALATPGVLTLALATPSVLCLGLGHVLATPKSLGCSLKHAWPPHFGSPSLS